MKPEQARHFQDLVELDGGSEEGMCKRTDCWDRQAGSISCWVFQGDGVDGRCGSCDHLPECHPKDGARQRESFFRSLVRGA